MTAPRASAVRKNRQQTGHSAAPDASGVSHYAWMIAFCNSSGFQNTAAWTAWRRDKEKGIVDEEYDNHSPKTEIIGSGEQAAKLREV